MTRIDDAYAIARQKPQSSIRRLRNFWEVAAGKVTADYSVRAVENRGLNCPVRIGHPTIELRTRNAHQSAGHVQPNRMVIVFNRPVDGVARQSVSSGERGDTTILQAAESALSGSPKCAILVGSKIKDRASAKAVCS